MKAKAKRTSLSYMIAAARKVWRWTPERRAVIERCKFFGTYKCEKCHASFDALVKRVNKQTKKIKLVTPIQVDHKVPIGKQPTTWAEFGPWCEKLFCPISNLWGICLACHGEKTHSETKVRRSKKPEVTAADLDEFAKRFPGQRTLGEKP